MTTAPRELALELVRATSAGDPYAFVLEEQAYVRHLEGGTARSASFPWGEAVLERLAAIQREEADPGAAAWLGEALRTFLEPLAWLGDEERLRAALDARAPVHLTVRLGAAELFALPWELVPLGAPGRPLGSLPGCLIRYEWPGTATARPEPDPPPEGGRVVFAWSAAGGRVPADAHAAAIRGACAEGHHGFDEARDVVAHASLGRLQSALREAPVAVLHLLCHGARRGDHAGAGASYGLVLDGDDGAGAEVVDARALQLALADHAGALRLVVLCACHGGHAGALDSRLGSVAQELHRLGIPAVVASRYPLAVDASAALAEALYRGLLAGATSLEEAFLSARDALRQSPGRAAWASLQLYARATDGPDHRPIVARPYRGLLAFQERHARYFFGRDDEIAEALRDLDALTGGGAPRFSIVTGASGSGKSSLVMAGVVPALKARDARWAVATLRPHEGWRASLDAALASRAEPGAPLLLVADQLEELFTNVREPAGRDAFVQALWRLSTDPASGVSVMATMRVDFLARCREIRLGERDLTLEDVAYDEAHRVFVRSLRAEPLRHAIEEPARRAGLVLEEGLCAQIIEDAGGEPGALPLVQYTLDELWQQRTGRALGWEAYRRLGGITGALEKKADAIVAGLDPVRQRAARRLLVQLVERRGGGALDTRRRARRDALRRGPADEAAVIDEVLDALVGERLIVLSEEEQPGAEGTRAAIVEVAHEQLIRSWGALRGWLEQDRKMLVELGQLEAWAKEAQGFQDFVLAGDRLGHAREIARRYPDDIDAGARELLARSEKAAARRRRAGIGLLVVAGVAAVVMAALVIVARGQYRSAVAKSEETARERDAARRAQAETDTERARAQDALLVVSARDFLQRNQPTTAILLLLEVKDPSRIADWRQVAHECLRRGAPKRTLRGHEGPVLTAAWSPDGARLVTGSSDSTARVWRADGSGEPVVLRGHTRPVVHAAFSPDGGRVLTISQDTTARVWRADGSGQTISFGGASHFVTAAAFSPDGERVVTASASDGTAKVWRADGDGEPVVLRGHEKAVMSAAWSPDGGRIVTASLDATARVWRADGSGKPIVLRGHESLVNAAAWSHDGRRVVTASVDHTVRVWSADGSGGGATGRHSDEVISAEFSRDGHYVISASKDGTARLWHVGLDIVPLKLQHQGPVTSAAFSPDGRRVVTASEDTTAQVWSVDGRAPPVFLHGHQKEVASAAFSPDGRYVVTASHDGTAQVWDAAGSGEPLVLLGHESAVDHAAWSPDGARLVSLSDDGRALLWRADGAGAPIELRGHEGKIAAVAFSPDGQRLATASHDGTARLWRLDGSEERVLRGHEGAVVALAWSPDGARLATASHDKTARIFPIDGAGPPIRLVGHEKGVTAVAFSRDGKRVATASEDRTARLWSEGGAALRVLPNPLWPILGVAFAAEDRLVVFTIDPVSPVLVWKPDGAGAASVLTGHVGSRLPALSPRGDRVAVWAPYGAIRIWRVDGSGDPITLRGLEAPGLEGPQGLQSILGAAFSPDGDRLVTVHHNTRAWIWNADGSGVPMLLGGHGGAVAEAAWSPDGARVATASSDRTVMIWSISPDALQGRLRALVTDCLPPATRRTYLGEGDDDARAGYEACERSHGRTPRRAPDGQP